MLKIVKPVPYIKCHEFLDLANTPRGQLPELIKFGEVDIDCGFSVEELLPSVEYVRDTIRFLLYQMTIPDSKDDIDNNKDAAIRGYRKIYLGSLEAIVDPRWKEKLPYFISCNFTVVSQIAQEAAKAFLEWWRMRNGIRPRFIRCRWKYSALDGSTGSPLKC